MRRLLITGAAGHLGTEMRERLAPLAETLRLGDIAPISVPGPNEEAVRCDLADLEGMKRLVAGCDGIVHLGGIAGERPFDEILQGNILGVYNLFEAARANGMPRIVFASSYHVVGYYPPDGAQRLRPSDPMRPDSLYGVSKCFGEAIASMYHSKFGQETLLVRIGSCFSRPRHRGMLSTWLSADDLARLIARAFEVDQLGCPIVWGVSDNPAGWWDNSETAWLGWVPEDTVEAFRAATVATYPEPAPDSAAARWQGGAFCDMPIYE